MDLRAEFMRRLAEGERVATLCREYGISRKTAYKFKERFERCGVEGLEDRSRAPLVIPHKTPAELEALIVAERKAHASWGGKKLKEVLEKRLERMLPCASAITAILKRNGLVEPRKKRRRYTPTPTRLKVPLGPNDLWCIDYKGQFRLGDRTYCYPLTVTDQFSRYILACEGMAAISEEAARDVCHELFRAVGLPAAIRSDNGAPFASTGLAGLTKLSVFWLRLGIALERIRPGHPEENGAHERMHRTLKFETARPSRSNILQQQERFDEFLLEFNEQRPHEALDMKTPAEVYRPSLRLMPARLPDPDYPTHDDVLRINKTGQLYIAGIGSIPVSSALAYQHVGVREERDGRWLISFASLDLGHAHRDKTFVPLESSNPPEQIAV